MPPVESGLIVVTGASGFIGGHTIRELLAAGYKVRATVRNKEKGEYLMDRFGKDKVEYAVVGDNQGANAYDEAVKGADGIIHLASPVDITNTGDPQLVIQPAVKGVTGILDSVAKNGQNVKRVVQISSTAALSMECEGGYAGTTLTEANWNDESVAICEKEGAAAKPSVKYLASKTIAERAFWKYFQSDSKPAYDGVSLLPSVVLGPWEQYVDANARVSGSTTFALPWMNPAKPAPDSQLESETWNVVDVRDVAYAIVKSLSDKSAGGERFILAAEPLWGNDYAIGARTLHREGLNKGNTDAAFRAALQKKSTICDGSKAEKAFGFKYRAKDDTLRDTFESIKAF